MLRRESRGIDGPVRVGDTVELQVDVANRTETVDGYVLSIGPDWLIVDLPGRAEGLGSVVGLEMTVVKPAADSLHMANARVTAQDPGPRLTLTRTGHWEHVQRRSSVRLPVSIKVDAAALKEGESCQPLSATILNISATGSLLRVIRSLPEGGRLRLKFRLPGVSQPLETEAEVVWTAVPDRRGGVHKAGVRFLGLRTRDEDSIVRFIYREQAKRAR